MKLYVPFILFSLAFFSCKKTFNKDSNPLTQIEALISKYPNLKLISFKPISEDTSASYITASSLADLDKYLAKLSRLAAGIRIKPWSDSMVTLEKVNTAILGNKATQIQSAQGLKAWSSTQTVGSSEVGYYDISYFATFSYHTDYTYPSGINKIDNATEVKSSAPTLTFSDGGSVGYHSYDYSYTAASSAFSIGSSQQIASLAFNGTAILKKTYHFLIYSTVVASVSEPISYNPSVFSSTFPKVPAN